MPVLRRLGIGKVLLDAVLDKSIYGMRARDVLSMNDGSRARCIAFSQPTMAGRKLAERWIRGDSNSTQPAGPRLLVFKEEW